MAQHGVFPEDPESGPGALFEQSRRSVRVEALGGEPQPAQRPTSSPGEPAGSARPHGPAEPGRFVVPSGPVARGVLTRILRTPIVALATVVGISVVIGAVSGDHPKASTTSSTGHRGSSAAAPAGASSSASSSTGAAGADIANGIYGAADDAIRRGNPHSGFELEITGTGADQRIRAIAGTGIRDRTCSASSSSGVSFYDDEPVGTTAFITGTHIDARFRSERLILRSVSRPTLKGELRFRWTKASCEGHVTFTLTRESDDTHPIVDGLLLRATPS